MRQRRVRAVALLIVGGLVLWWGLFWIVPQLPAGWPQAVGRLGGAAFFVMGLLASVAQISGYSLRDLMEGRRATPPPSGDMRGSPTPDRRRELTDLLASAHGPDSDLPKVLARCLVLCQEIGGLDEYRRWLHCELHGYGDGIQADLEWVQRWTTHRQVATYLKFHWVNPKTGELQQHHVDCRKIHLTEPLASLIQTVEEARQEGQLELSVDAASLGAEFLRELHEATAPISRYLKVPKDLHIYFERKEAERVFVGVRVQVEAFIQEVRRQEKHAAPL